MLLSVPWTEEEESGFAAVVSIVAGLLLMPMPLPLLLLRASSTMIGGACCIDGAAKFPEAVLMEIPNSCLLPPVRLRETM